MKTKIPLRHRRVSESDAGRAFVRDYRRAFRAIHDGDVEAAGAEFIAGATSIQPVAEIARDELYPGELGEIVFDADPPELIFIDRK